MTDRDRTLLTSLRVDPVAEPFDPFRDWLGVDGGRASLDYYRLLGLVRFESDPRTIAAAIVAAAARIDRAATPSQEASRQLVLAELDAAERCLMDPASRGQYNAWLQSGSPADETPAAAAARPRRTAAPPDVESLPIRDAWWEEAVEVPTKLHSATLHSPWPSLLAIVLGFVLASVMLAASGGVWWWLQSERDLASTPAPNMNPAVPSVPDPTLAEPTEESQAEPTSLVSPTVPATKPHPVGNPTDAADDAPPATATPDASLPSPTPSDRLRPVENPAQDSIKPAQPIRRSASSQAPAFRRAMNLARAALASRELGRAEEQLAQAEKQAQTADDRERVKRLQALHAEVSRFFAAVRSGLKRLEPTDELQLDDGIVSVIEADPDGVSLFVEGSRHNYTLATMPAPVAREIASYGADESEPEAQVFFGAFQAVDPQGDRHAARTLWTSAAAAGRSVDDLLPLLEDASLSIEREAVPPRLAVAAAVERIDKSFSAQISLAKSTQRKSELADSLLAASRAAEDSADQYALLTQASRWATTAPDSGTALGAIDELSRWFEVDALSLKSAALAKASAAPGNPATASHIARAALTLSDQAESEHRDELARSLSESAAKAAAKSRDAELIKKANVRRREADKSEKKSSKASGYQQPHEFSAIPPKKTGVRLAT